MWWIAFFPIAGIMIGILLYFLRPFLGQTDVFMDEEAEETED